MRVNPCALSAADLLRNEWGDNKSGFMVWKDSFAVIRNRIPRLTMKETSQDRFGVLSNQTIFETWDQALNRSEDQKIRAKGWLTPSPAFGSIAIPY